MSAMEKLLVQIFERKNRIIDHVKQQTLLFDHYLSSKCLIDGFDPPPWLVTASKSELNKEDLISELLFSHPQPSIPYCSLYQQPVFTRDNEQLADVSCTQVDASNEGLDQCVSGKADELDPSVTSPAQDCRDGKILNIGPDLGLSLAKIQRSKSRQWALEHRNSAKSCNTIEGCKKKGDARNSIKNGSNIASLQSDPVDKLELIRSDDNVVSCAVEGEGEKYLREERNEHVYSGRVTRARSSVQPSKCAGGPSSAGNTTSVAKLDNVVVSESIDNSRQQPHVVLELMESKFIEHVHNTEGCLENNKKRSQCWSKERSEDVYSDQVMRSRSSVLPPKSGTVSGPPSARNSFRAANKDGFVLTESIKKSRLQADTANELLQFFEPIDNIATCVVTKVETGCQRKEKGENMYSGRITRSRSSVQFPEFVDGLSSAGKTFNVEKSDSNYSYESCSSRNARESQSKENENNDYQGRLKKSGGSCQQQQDNYVNKHLKLDSSLDRGNDDVICKSMQLAFHEIDLSLTLPYDIPDESYVIKAEASKHQKKENTVLGQSNGGSIRTRASCAKLLNLVHSSDTLDYDVAQCESTAFDKSPYAKLSDRYEGVEPNEAFGTQEYSMPCVSDSYLANLNPNDAIVADTDADSDELVEAHLAGSASNLDGASNPSVQQSLNSSEKIELNVIVTSPPFESALTVMSKQLDFDNLGQCTLNKASDLELETENEIKSLEKRPLTHLFSSDKLDELNYVHRQDRYYGCLKKQLETDLNRTPGTGITSNLNIASSVKETPEASLHAVASTLPERNTISEQNIFVDEQPTTSKASYESMFRNSAKDTSGLWKCSERKKDYLKVKDCGNLEVVQSIKCFPESSNCDTDICRDPATLAEIHLTGVCSALLRKTYATSSNETKHPYATQIEETEGNSVKQKRDSSPQNVDKNSMGSCTAEDFASILDPTLSKSSEHKIAVHSIQQCRHAGSDVIHVNGSWPCKQRKIDGQQSDSSSFPFSSKGKCALEVKCRSESSSSTFVHKQFDVTSVSSFPHEILGNSENLLADGTDAVHACGIMHDSTAANKFQTLLDVGDLSEFGNIERLASDDRSKQESKSQLKEAGEFSSCPISSPCQQSTHLINADKTSPELEGFIIQTNNEQICISGKEVGFDKLDLLKTTMERASLLEQLCKSASIHTPLSQFPSTYALQRATNFYQSVPNGILECIELRSSLPKSGDRRSPVKVSSSFFGDNLNHAFLGGHFSDCLPCSSSQVNDVKRPYLSPVSKLWDRITLNSDSSEKRGSLKSDLPCISEENENTDEMVEEFHRISASKVLTCSVKRKPLAEITECSNLPASVSVAEIFHVRDSLDSVNTAYSFTGTENWVQQKVGKNNASKRRDTNKMKENLSIPPVANSRTRASESLRNRFSNPKAYEKTSLKNGGRQKESKVNNIVSNVTSFIPIVQQKQAAAVITGKRDVRVKALEAAEAAKRLAEKKEDDRKMKKEALKLERARLEQENLRQLELEKKKKEEERKKKEADMAARKRQREEEERLEKERKRKRTEEARRQQRAPEEKLRAKKDEKDMKCEALNEAETLKFPNEEDVKHQKMQNEIADGNEGKVSETEFMTAVASTSDVLRATTTTEDFNAKVMSTTATATESENVIADIIQEQSYDISPYKGSDDEDEDDDQPSRKFIPSWASKTHVAQLLTSQEELDPEVIFPPKSFCSISEVLLPRKLQQCSKS